jgi:hypothetical protein
MSVELREQARLIRWARRAARSHLNASPLARLYHSPNGGLRSARAGAQMVALGTLPGWPDLVLIAPDRPPLAIEMKAFNGRATKAQQDWMAYLETCGWTVRVCRSADEARLILCLHLQIDPSSTPPLD